MVRLDPLAGDVLLHGLSHVAEEGARRVVRGRGHAHAVHVSRVHLIGSRHTRGRAHLVPGGGRGRPVRRGHARQARPGHPLHWVVQATEGVGGGKHRVMPVGRLDGVEGGGDLSSKQKVSRGRRRVVRGGRRRGGRVLR